MTLSFSYMAPVKQVTDKSLGAVLADIESRMPNGHIYRDNDPVTHGHETTHGISSVLRQKAGARKNAFYVLNGNYAVLDEPPITIQSFAGKVPQELRGPMTYDLYLVKQAVSWGGTALYVTDEWNGYLNGSACGVDLQERGLWKQGPRGSTILSMLEFALYNIVMVLNIKNPAPDLVEFVRYQIDRSLNLYERSLNCPDFNYGPATTYLSKVVNSPYTQWMKPLAPPTRGTEEFL